MDQNCILLNLQTKIYNLQRNTFNSDKCLKYTQSIKLLIIKTIKKSPLNYYLMYLISHFNMYSI